MNENLWPLNINNFTLWDRLKFAMFVLNKNNRWTMGRQTDFFEKEMAEYVGVKHAIFCSNGSTANTLLAMRVRDKVEGDRNQVIFPSTTWQTSCSPWIREGFDPVFIDISLSNLCMDLVALEKYLEGNSDKVAAVFVTSLLGFSPDVETLLRLQSKYPNTYFALDNCENTLGSSGGKNICAKMTSTTSTYFGHEISSVEGGFVFTNSDEECEIFKSYKNHGMIRGRSAEFVKENANSAVDNRFDFALMGNNFRNSDLHAFLGRLDLKRVKQYKKDRIELAHAFYGALHWQYNEKTNYNYRTDVPFCLPIICQTHMQKLALQDCCHSQDIETRPIISGNLLRQTCYKKYGDVADFPNSEKVDSCGFYIGLYSGLTLDRVLKLAELFNIYHD